MCGKFTQLASYAEVRDFSRPLVYIVGDGVQTTTPMRWAHVIILNGKGERESVPMRWGFVKAGAESQSRPEHMHARAETIDTRRTFAEPFQKRRGILMVTTFNEGEQVGSRTKQWTISPKDGQPIAIAVIWNEDLTSTGILRTFVQVTVPANDLIAKITDRMAAILPPEDWSTWLGETEATSDKIKAVLKTYDDAGAWEMAPQETPPRPKTPKRGADDLFS